MLTHGPNGLIQRNLAPIHDLPLFGQLIGQLLGGHRAEQLALFAGLSLKLEDNGFQASLQGCEVLHFLGLLIADHPLLVLNFLHPTLGGQNGLSLG